MTEQLYSVRELANHFDVGENYIFSMVRDGKLKAHETNPIKVSEAEVTGKWKFWGMVFVAFFQTVGLIWALYFKQ